MLVLRKMGPVMHTNARGSHVCHEPTARRVNCTSCVPAVARLMNAHAFGPGQRGNGLVSEFIRSEPTQCASVNVPSQSANTCRLYPLPAWLEMRIGVFLALIISTSRRLLGCVEAIDGCTHAGASSGATYNTTAWQLACLSRLHRSRIEIKVATQHLSLFRKLACPGGGVDPGRLPAPDPARVQQGSLVSSS